MREQRLTLDSTRHSAYYHVISRCAGGAMLLEHADREDFLRILRAVSAFTGVEVVTYALMRNHLHLELYVPQCTSLDDAEIVRRYDALYGVFPDRNQPGGVRLAELLAGGGELAEAWRNRLLRRMHNLSEFMRCLMQRFVQRYHRRHRTFGALFAERFTSNLVQDRLAHLIACYVDLNPLRAGLVDDPRQSCHNGYSAAVAGDSWARAGLCRLYGVSDWELVAALHRMRLHELGAIFRTGKAAMDPEKAHAVVLEAMGQVLRRARVVGDEGYQIWLRETRGRDAERPKHRPIPLTGALWESVCTYSRLMLPRVL